MIQVSSTSLILPGYLKARKLSLFLLFISPDENFSLICSYIWISALIYFRNFVAFMKIAFSDTNNRRLYWSHTHSDNAGHRAGFLNLFTVLKPTLESVESTMARLFPIREIIYLSDPKSILMELSIQTVILSRVTFFQSETWGLILLPMVSSWKLRGISQVSVTFSKNELITVFAKI